MVVVASTAREGFSQQKLNSLTPSRMQDEDQSNKSGESKPLSKGFPGGVGHNVVKLDAYLAFQSLKSQ